MISDYFFANFEYTVNQLGFRYPEIINQYNDDFIIIDVEKSSVPALNVTIQDV
jgi:hypothetical protein